MQPIFDLRDLIRLVVQLRQPLVQYLPGHRTSLRSHIMAFIVGT